MKKDCRTLKYLIDNDYLVIKQNQKILKMIQMKCCSMIAVLFSILIFLSIDLHAQGECEVLLKALEGEYTGDCKKGLAHGSGQANGMDSYKGEFKKGMPHGDGTYLWMNGNSYSGSFKDGMKDGKGKLVIKRENQADSIVAGYWSKDEYVGLTLMGYEVISKSGTISLIMVRYKAPGPNYIEIQGIDRAIELNANPNFYPFENMYKNVDYPVVVKLKGKSTKPDSVADLDFEIFFEKPGYWLVTIESQ